ncbi:hypothetical protein [Stenotrophomonas nitritireducens]|uniref:hypothetical protein n=1 Tax=Stenotrophomonas nitritireducens TaxID=83617 RepID=UPI003D9632B9
MRPFLFPAPAPAAMRADGTVVEGGTAAAHRREATSEADRVAAVGDAGRWSRAMLERSAKA